ncbi:hypothetical protein [Streptomyces sp. 900116325]
MPGKPSNALRASSPAGSLLEAKARGRAMPSPVLVASTEALHHLVTHFFE